MRETGKSTSKFSREILICAALAILTLAIFSKAITLGFVDYDDGDYVTGNKHVQQGLTWAGVKWAFTTGHASNWHPLTWISHMLDWQLFGEKPAGHHFTSVLFHTFNALLLFCLLRRMTAQSAAGETPAALWRCAFVAAIFALHPLRVESVAWVSERKDVLSTFFWLLTTIYYVRYAQAKEALDSRRPTLDYSLALLCFALGLLSKPMLVTLPFVLLLLDFWPLGRRAKREIRSAGSGLLRLVYEKIPFFALATTSSVITFLVQKEGGAVSSALSLGDRISNALISYCRYIYKLFWPEKLSVLYPHPGTWPAWQVIGAAIVLVAISAFAVQQIRRRPYLFTGWFWFLGTMVPVIGIVQVGIQSMADRYTYIPMIGLTVALVWGIAELCEKIPHRIWIFRTATAAALIACSLLTWKQIGHWKNTQTLFEHAIRTTEKNYLAHNNLGFYLSAQSRKLTGAERERKLDEAIEQYEKSIGIRPDYEEARNNLGHALAEKGRHQEAIQHYRLALKKKPDLIEAHNNLGNALSEIGKIDEAISHYHFVLERKADNVDAHNNLGVALAMKGQFDEAMRHLRTAVELNPNSGSAHSNLGNAFAVQGRIDEAIVHFRAALKISTNDSKTHNNLANALAHKGLLDEAIENYRTAIRIEPRNPEAHFNLALALTRKGARAEAIELLNEALRQRPNYLEAQRHLHALLDSK